MFGGSSSASAGPTLVSGVNLQTSVAGIAIVIGYGQNRIAPNVIWYGDFVAKPIKSGGDKGGGSAGKNGTGSSDYLSSFQLALCHGPIVSIGAVYNSKAADTMAQHTALTLFTGTSTQNASSYMVSTNPSYALNYRNIAYIEANQFDMGQSAQLPNFNFEVLFGINTAWGGGPPDADPGAVVIDFLKNTRYGVLFPAANLGNLSVFSSYCIATGLTSSPVFDTASPASQLLNDYVTAHNAEFVWSGSVLSIVPYGDQAITANGATYTPPSNPLYSLTDDDFLDDGQGKGPIIMTRDNPQDRQNLIRVEWSDRSNQYALAICEARDQSDIEQHKRVRNNSTTSSHWFCRQACAQLSATLALQREAVRNKYTFTLGQKFIGLDPMDIVAITDTEMGLNAQWVRILSIEENSNGDLKMEAEEYLGGTGGAPVYNTEPNRPFIWNYNVDPGNVNTPFIWEPPPSALANNDAYRPEVWLGASSSNPYWGGCRVLISEDGGVNYKYFGRIIKAARQGFLTATLALGVDPDTTNTASVDLTESLGVLTSVSSASADKGHTLCLIDSEVIGFSTATLTALNKYNLTTYIRRGMLGTAIAVHSPGASVTRLDDTILRKFLPTAPISHVGQTLYFKFQSFNIYGGALQDDSTLSAYTYVPGGPSTFVAPPTSISVASVVTETADDNWVTELQISWGASTDPLFHTYEIQYSQHGLNIWSTVKVDKTTLAHTVRSLPSGVAYDVQVRAVRIQGGPFYSAWVQGTNFTVAKKTTLPNAPASLVIVSDYRKNILEWTASTSGDLHFYKVYRGTTNVFGSATLIASHSGTTYTDDHLALGVVYFYWVTTFDRTGNESAAVGPQQGAGAISWDSTNLLVDSEFQDSTYWTLINPGAITAYMVATVPPAAGNGANTIASLTAVHVTTSSIPVGTGLYYGADSPYIRVGQRLWYRGSCNAIASGAGVNKNCGLFINWYDNGYNYLSTSLGSGLQTQGLYGPADTGDLGTVFDAGNGDVMLITAQAPVGAFYAIFQVLVYDGGAGSPVGTGSGWAVGKCRLERQVERSRIQALAVHREHIAPAEVQTTHLAPAAVSEPGFVASLSGPTLTTAFVNLASFTALDAGLVYLVAVGSDTPVGGATSSYQVTKNGTLVPGATWSSGGCFIATAISVSAGDLLALAGKRIGGTSVTVNNLQITGPLMKN